MIKIYKITNLPMGFVWAWNLVPLIKEGTWFESVPELCVGSDRRLEKNVLRR
jgi:hypothetical protein